MTEPAVTLVSNMVLGFAFSDTMSRVLLLKHGDSGPEIVRGKWNGVGGKVDSADYEHPDAYVAAMRREFREEVGLDIAEDRWRPCLVFGGDDWQVHTYSLLLATLETQALERESDKWSKILGDGRSIKDGNVMTAGADPVQMFNHKPGDSWSNYSTLDIVPNLLWLVPLHHQRLTERFTGSLRIT